jgi:hypothetical protein
VGDFVAVQFASGDGQDELLRVVDVIADIAAIELVGRQVVDGLGFTVAAARRPRRLLVYSRIAVRATACMERPSSSALRRNAAAASSDSRRFIGTDARYHGGTTATTAVDLGRRCRPAFRVQFRRGRNGGSVTCCGRVDDRCAAGCR